MTVKKEEWIEGKVAAAILTKLSGHTITINYVRQMGNKNMIRSRKKDGRTNEYHRKDIENYRVRKNRTSEEVRRAKEE